MKVSEIYGILTFNEKVMKNKLSYEVYKRFKKTIKEGEPITKDVAECIAHALKEWAIENNCTHYTHWFHPLTGLTAEKHDAFLTFDENLMPIERFLADELIQGEPDASSFPSGGTRSTFEARGYTAWDPQSPCFIIEGKKTNTLCIPSVFLSYNGDSLDKKSILLKSIKVLEESTKKLLEVSEFPVPEKISITTGPEQEYYLLDKEVYRKREDLIITGRTLIGANSVKGQKLEDHYFGSIPDRVKYFMEDLELALYKLGVPAKTRHNEVAPCQFELAPIFEELNIAADHNHLVMIMLKKKAEEHGFSLLLHEKPFKGLNGSGKHNNWSIADNRGVNYLSPGKNKEEFLRFLVFFVGVINGVYNHQKFIRASVASAANDHRLGGNEAPPSIISVFVGSALGEVLENLKEGNFVEPKHSKTLEIGLSYLPQITRHNTDRNRTSPIAFTGNKFEFRAVGSSQPLGLPNTILNASVADSFNEISELIKEEKAKGKNREEAILIALSKVLKKCSKVIFNGNGYSKEWQIEAEKRGLANLKNTPESLKNSFADAEERKFLIDLGIMSERELNARLNIKYDQYSKIIDIESRMLVKLIKKYVRTAALKQIDMFSKFDFLNYSEYIKAVKTMEEKTGLLINETQNFEPMEGERKAFFAANTILPLMNELREIVDFLETETDKSIWPLPDYDSMLIL
ncbi:glutamine synthetase [Thermotomaculum hydrothermale]|uniref:Glutamine synthetase n=1 Tax=Thermotomaculum hydrothermale TaxID=981385 RepID=A0A7R6PVJ7_9BACT|nr:glutamine synthetase III [Thermotomaculum hydrothermale]BBB33417.1 glutamine synthetase [Thermotomaculum hydrothermale]